MVNLFPLFVLLIGFCKMDTLHLSEDAHTRPFLFSRFSSLWAETLPSTVLDTQGCIIYVDCGIEMNPTSDRFYSKQWWSTRKAILSPSSHFQNSGQAQQIIIILHLPTLLFSDHSDLFSRYRPLMVVSCLVFWLFPVSKISFSSNNIVETFSHVAWVSSLFRSCLLSDTDPLNPGSLHCYYWLRL